MVLEEDIPEEDIREKEHSQPKVYAARLFD